MQYARSPCPALDA